MRIQTYVSTFAALIPFLFPLPCLAQIAVPFTFPLPLEVRSPYLNFWTQPPSLSGNSTTSAKLFFAEAFSGRTALLRIDGVTHSIFGQLALAPQLNITGSFITPTRTIFTLNIGPVEISVTFFSPIEPHDRVRQSIPFTYISFDLNVTDGKPHNIQLYAHVQSGAFFAMDSVQNMTWSTVSTGQSVIEVTELQNPQPLSENVNGQAEWGQFYFATAQSDAVTFGVGSVDSLINTFYNHGNLYTIPVTGSQAGGFSDTTTAFAFSRNLSVITQNATTVFAFGFIQDPAVLFIDTNGQPQRRVPYFKTKYSTPEDLIDDLIGDYMAASLRNLGLEAKIFIDTERYPHDYYSTLLSLATRLVFASTMLTVGETSDGTLDSTDVMMFMKNIGAVSDTNRMNPVEVLYAAFPMFLYFNPDLGGLLLEPLLRYQAWPNADPPYASRDAGTSYPITSISETHYQGVEQTANMLLMIYAHARTSGNVTLIQKHIPRMNNWTEYLIVETLYTTQQESASLLSIYNQTDLAIKGIIAIKAMSVMSDVAGQSKTYSSIADSYYAQWKSQALSSDNHLLIQYGNESSWSLGENMFADMWLQTGLISQDIFTAHVNFLKTVNTTAAPQTYNIAETGIPLDSLRINNVTYSSNMFAAGFADTELQSIILSSVQDHPLAEDLSIVNNTLTIWSPSPNLGAAYAPLILNVPLLNIVPNTSARSSSSANRRLGIAFGSVISIALFAGLFVFLYLTFYQRLRTRVRARQTQKQTRKQSLNLSELKEQYLNRVSRRRRHNNHTRPVTEGSRSSDTATDPFARITLEFIPPLELSKSAPMGAHRSSRWMNLEDYEYMTEYI